MVDDERKAKILRKQNEILKLLDQMIAYNIDGDPKRDMLPVFYCVETITTQVRLLARILQERR